jgi:hypothetical protein
MNELFDRMVDQVLRYKPPAKGKKAEAEEAAAVKKKKKAKPKKS